MAVAIAIFLVLVILYFFKDIILPKQWLLPQRALDEKSKRFLYEHVAFYQQLSEEHKSQFEFEVQEFLLNYKITAIKTIVSREDELLIAASGVIPIFAFPDWKYQNLKEILVYPDSFNLQYEIKGPDRWVAGVVGNGALGSKMILSKKAIIHGFADNEDGHNTALHEFIHLIDGADGDIDGVPLALLEKAYVLPWIDLIKKEMEKISTGDSALRNYGAYNWQEFLAVASEYFFEKPQELKQAHPELYEMLARIFMKKG